MNIDQLTDEIKANRLCYLVVTDWNDNRLSVINEKNSDRASKVLNDRLANYSGYKRLIVTGKKDPQAKKDSEFSYELDMKVGKSGEEKSIGNANGSIGAMEYISMYTKMMGDQFALQKDLLEIKMKQDQNDPAKWMPVIQQVMGMFGKSPIPASIQGPELRSGTMKAKNNAEGLNEKEVAEKIMGLQKSLATKMKGSQFAQILENLDKNPQLINQVDKIIILLDKVAEKPQLVDSALTFL